MFWSPRLKKSKTAKQNLIRAIESLDRVMVKSSPSVSTGSFGGHHLWCPVRSATQHSRTRPLTINILL